MVPVLSFGLRDRIARRLYEHSRKSSGNVLLRSSSSHRAAPPANFRRPDAQIDVPLEQVGDPFVVRRLEFLDAEDACRDLAQEARQRIGSHALVDQ